MTEAIAAAMRKTAHGEALSAVIASLAVALGSYSPSALRIRTDGAPGDPKRGRISTTMAGLACCRPRLLKAADRSLESAPVAMAGGALSAVAYKMRQDGLRNGGTLRGGAR